VKTFLIFSAGVFAGWCAANLVVLTTLVYRWLNPPKRKEDGWWIQDLF
jgi:hypothetical protein